MGPVYHPAGQEERVVEEEEERRGRTRGGKGREERGHEGSPGGAEAAGQFHYLAPSDLSGSPFSYTSLTRLAAHPLPFPPPFLLPILLGTPPLLFSSFFFAFFFLPSCSPFPLPPYCIFQSFHWPLKTFNLISHILMTAKR